MVCEQFSVACACGQRALRRTGRAIAGVNQTISYVPRSGSLDRFGHATNWFFVGMMILSGAVYFTNGIRYDTTSAGVLHIGVDIVGWCCRAVHLLVKPCHRMKRVYGRSSLG